MTTKYEFYSSGDDADEYIVTHWWVSQTFTPQTNHAISSVKLYLSRYNNPGTITVEIRATDANGKPTGAALCSGTTNGNTLPITPSKEWREITFTTTPTLNSGTKYAIVVSTPGATVSDNLLWRKDQSSPSYSGGSTATSDDSGVTWTLQTGSDQLFEEYGEPPPEPPTPQTDAATTVLITEATLNGTLLNDGGLNCDLRFNYGKTTGYGTNTDWQTPKHTNDQAEQLIESLDPNTTYHFRLEAKNNAGTVYGTDQEFTTSAIPPAVGKDVKALIRHPALKQVRVIAEGQEIANYDLLSDPEQQRIETALEIPCPTPCTVEVTTLADQIFSFEIPFKS